MATTFANLNTPGFKQSRVIFSDLFYQTLKPATGSIAGSIGGTNPVQIGSGSILAQVDVDQSQGSLETTGGETDFALSGNGYFVLSDGKQNFFTRVGAFDVDESGVLVDRATGNRVLRTGTVGELFGTNPGFQTSGNTDILVPKGASIAGEQTTELEVKGVLSSDNDNSVVEILTSIAPFLNKSAVAAVGTTTLNQLAINSNPYAVGDGIDITGVDSNGTDILITFTFDDTTTLDQLIAAIDSAFSGATASLDSSGNLVLTADESGDVPLALELEDNPSNENASDFTSTNPEGTTAGMDGGTVMTTFEMFDPQGGFHSISLSFERGAGNVWELTATINAEDGVMVDGSVEDLRFDENGGLLSAGSVGTGDTNLTVLLTGFSTPQTIALDFGIGADGLKSNSEPSSLRLGQNGFGPGTLISISVDVNGVIEGAASNGRRVPIAQLAIASFSNPKGLTNVGNNYLVESLNSGPVQIGTALSSGRGSVVGGQIESSNVDIALQFTKMIIAQRGFSANARTITITDEILEELTNLIR